jgi:hypothetical protein
MLVKPIYFYRRAYRVRIGQSADAGSTAVELVASHKRCLIPACLANHQERKSAWKPHKKADSAQRPDR